MESLKPGSPGVIATYSGVVGSTIYNGQGTGGELRVAGCIIGGRVVEPNTGQIIYEVMVHGQFDGDLLINKMITDPISSETYDTTFEGAFELLWTISTTSETDDMALFLERKCVNGRTRPVLSSLAFLLGDEIVRRWGESRSGADTRLNLVAANLSRDAAIAWTHSETPPTTPAQALHLTLAASEGPQTVGEQVVLPTIVPDCTGQQEPACMQAGGIAVGFYDWSDGSATRALQAQSGTVTLTREADRVIRATLDVTFDDASEITGWQMRFIE